MSLIERLKAIKVRKQADKDTLAQVVHFIEEIQKYNEIQKYALSLIGYEPILHTESEEGEGI